MNKFKKFLSIMLCSSMVFSNVGTVQAAETTEAEEYSIYPIVRDINYDGTAFTMDKQVNVVYETGIDTATRSYLEEVLADNGVEATFVEAETLEEENDVFRICGKDRNETSLKVADQVKAALGVEKFDAVIVATGKDYADALTGSYLAKVKKAPILLTNSSEKANRAMADYIQKNVNSDATIYILGGTSAVSEATEDLLKEQCGKGKVVRLAGNTRLETNTAILKEAGVKGQSDLLIATSKSFADSLSAAATGKPILLVNSSKALNEDQKKVLEQFKDGKIYVLGGENAVSKDAVKEIASLTGKTAEEIEAVRLAGKNRFETSVMIADEFFKEAKSAVVACGSGQNYPDGLCGGALASALNAPLLLTKNEDDQAAAYAKANGIHSGYVLGGSDKLVSDDAAKAIFGVDEIKENKSDVKAVKASKNEWNILLGINGSEEAVDQYEDQLTVKTENLYDQFDGYLLEAKDQQITIVGGDSDAVFRGVATLKMMLSSFDGLKLLGAQIEDYAGIEYRGFIEGFYGGWDYETRESLMNFARDVKMNMYVYASKTDVYHTTQWNALYPDSQIKEIENLVKIGQETKCYYVWSVHLGSFFTGISIAGNPDTYEARYEQLVAKLTQLYNAGVRKFDILNDDFGGGSHADVVTLLNRLTEEFIEPKGCDPITYCPQGYNKSWSGTGAELAALKNLDDSIILYWTGDDVNSPITQETVDYVSERTGQPICFWLNYPVNEHAKSGIFLGNITHYARDGVTGLRAAVSNPSRFGQSNKAALFQLASLFWNNSNYSEHSEEVWLGAYDYLQPEVKEEYLTIARNVANCPNSSRVTAGFPESEYIKENLEAVLEKVSNGESVKDLEDVEILQNEFDTILEAVEVFKEDCTNTALVSELTPWLNSLTDVTTACKSALECVVALENDDVAGAWSSFAAASKAFQSWDSYPTYTGDTNKALAGSKRLQPFAMKLINYAENILKPLLDSNYTDFTPTFYAKLGGTVKSHDSVAEKIFDGDTSTSAQWNVNQKKDDYYGVDLGRVMNVTDITILQGNTDTDHDYFHKAVLEYSEDGVNFTQIGEQYDDQVSIAVDGLDIQARYVRLRLVETGTATKLDFWTHVREFTVNKTAPDGNRIYTNAAAYAKQPLTSKGKEWSVADLTDVTLEAGGYIGIKFVDLVNAASFTADGTGIEDLTLEASENGMVWTEVTDRSASQVLKYVRLVNKTADAITFDLEKLGVTTESSKINPKFLETNLTNGLQSGSWENLFDGDKSTYIWTNEGQTAGDYITFDLGTQVPLYDVTVYTYDGNPRFYNAEIQISKDNKTWETIATVENDNSIMEVPCRYVKAEPDGTEARYLRIYITGNTGYYLRLHEIIINESVETVSDGTEKIQATFGNDIENAIDGNLSTLFTGIAGREDSVTYKFTEGTRYNAISILQDPYKVSNAKVSVLTDKGYEELGKLDESAKKFTLDVEKDVYGMKLEFEQETEISIYEIYLDHAANTTDDLGEYVDPIVIEEDVLEPSNIALNKTVTVSGTSDGDKANVNDGSVDTKWDSDYIKGNNAKENAWVCIDLGRGSTSIFDTSKVSYFNKIYPTVSKIQISNDGENWITVSELTSEHNGATYPVVTTTFEPALTARYVRLFFEELNSAAAGNGVGVREWEITGITVNDVAVKNIQKFETQTVEQNTSLEELDLADFVTVTLTSKNSGDFKVQVPVSWNTEAYDASNAGTYELEGILNLPESVTVTEAQKAVVTISVK